jgi:D-alanyl-D-alanine carboxypeptidase
MTTLLRRLAGIVAAVLLAGAFTASPALALDDGGAIDAAYQRLGAGAGPLGDPVSAGRCGLSAGGCVRQYRGGSIHWSAASGAHATWGGIEARWAQLGWEAGQLAYPLGEEHCGLRAGGCYQDFQGGKVYWSPASGANPVWGAILQRYASLGWETGQLGYPVGGEHCGLRSGGCYQDFQGGKVYWSPAFGTNPVWGAIGAYWASYGWENGPFGYPTSGESCAGSCTQTFWGGRITWNPSAPMSYRLWDWNPLIAVNKRHPLSPLWYAPPSLTAVGTQQMRADAAGALQRMVNDAAAAGVTITTVSGYRSYSDQVSLYSYYVAQYGQAYADTISARPGYSEHQTGLAMDIGNPNGACALQACFSGTPAGSFAAANAWRYGFIVRYPDGYQGITGYSFEPWHLRYVGPDAAAQMRTWGVRALEQYFAMAPAPTY